MTTKQKINLFLLGTIAIISLASVIYEYPVTGIVIVMILVLAYFIFFFRKEPTQQIKLLHRLGLWLWGLLGIATLIIIGIATYYKLDEQYSKRQAEKLFQQHVQTIQQEFLRGLKWVYRNTGTLEQCQEANPGDKHGCSYGLLAIQSGIDRAIEKNPTTNYDCDDQDWMFSEQTLEIENNSFRNKCTQLVLEHECKKGRKDSCRELKEPKKFFYTSVWAIDAYDPNKTYGQGWIKKDIKNLFYKTQNFYPYATKQAIQEAIMTL